MRGKEHHITILMAEDDKDDQLLVRESFEETNFGNEIFFVEDGQQLIDFLRRRPPFNKKNTPTPDLILLDLNMPRKDGREALQEIKQDPELNHIPIIVLTTSRAEEDIIRTYKLGVAGFITKPPTFEELVHVVKTIGEYWLKVVNLPPKNN